MDTPNNKHGSPINWRNNIIRILLDLGIAIAVFFLTEFINIPNVAKLSLLGRFLFALLFFALADTIMSRIRMEQKLVSTLNDLLQDREEATEQHMGVLVKHLAAECYGSCSIDYGYCLNCEQFLINPNQYNGLIRSYLYEDCKALGNSIGEVGHGRYFLNTNIERYHEIAIRYMEALRCNCYGVIHTIGLTSPDEEPYDGLDYHFLDRLLDFVQEQTFQQKQPYYKQVNFKIKWLFIGNSQFMKNNFDYIFYVISQRSDIEKIKEFFEFYELPVARYIQLRQGEKAFGSLVDEETPSIGIFGDKFVFVDSLEHNNAHGNIYTSAYDGVAAIMPFFEKLLKSSKRLEFESLQAQYNKLLESERTSGIDYGKTLELRWIKPRKPTYKK